MIFAINPVFEDDDHSTMRPEHRCATFQGIFKDYPLSQHCDYVFDLVFKYLLKNLPRHLLEILIGSYLMSYVFAEQSRGAHHEWNNFLSVF